MIFCFPSAKLLAAVHVGSLSGVGRRSDHHEEQPTSNHHQYELHGPAIDVCRQVVAETSAASEEQTEPFNVKVTKDALGDDHGRGWEALSLVEDSACVVVSPADAKAFRVSCYRTQ